MGDFLDWLPSPEPSLESSTSSGEEESLPPTPDISSTSEDESRPGEEERPSKRRRIPHRSSLSYVPFLKGILFSGLIDWENFKIMSKANGHYILLQLYSPFSLQYLALKTWFNSTFWNEQLYRYFRDQTLWDQMKFRVNPIIPSSAYLSWKDNVVNISTAADIRNRLKLLTAVKRNLEDLPQNMQRQFFQGICINKLDIVLKNETRLYFRDLNTSHCSIPDECEGYGVEKILQPEDYDKIKDYNSEEEKFIFKERHS